MKNVDQCFRYKENAYNIKFWHFRYHAQNICLADFLMTDILSQEYSKYNKPKKINMFMGFFSEERGKCRRVFSIWGKCI